MVSDVFEESSDIVRQVFSDVVFMFDKLFDTSFLGPFFYFVLVTATLLPVIRFIFSLLGDSFFGSDSEVLSSEDFVRCDFFRQHRCPYGLKDFNYDWCRKYCQMGIYDDDEYDEED